MKRLLPVLGALVLVAGVVAVVAWQRSDVRPELPKYVVLQYADGSELWRTGGTETFLVKQVIAELAASASLSLDQLRDTGAIVVTTINPKTQAAATAAVDETSKVQNGLWRYSLTAVDPVSGGVKAYMPGFEGTDFAGGVLKEPGTAFFPFNVVAALQAGRTLDSVYDGRSPREFGTGFAFATIADNANCGQNCTVRDALLKSSNVAMYDLVVNDVGIKSAVTAAHQAGVPEAVDINGFEMKLFVGPDRSAPNGELSLGGRHARMRPLDLAAAYATFAAEGVRRTPHFITHVTDGSGITLYRAVNAGKPAFDQDPARSKEIANQVTSVLKADPACGERGLVACRPGVQMMDKPDHDKIQNAWLVGYDQDLSVSVFVGADEATRPIADPALPRKIWEKFEEKNRP